MRVRAPGAAGEDGFSLIEVLVALAILSITLLASTPFFVGSLTNVNKQRGKQTAIQIAGTAMEQVRGLKGSSLLSGHGRKAAEDQFAAAPPAVQPFLATMQVGWDADSAVATTEGADAPISTAAQVTTIEGIPYTRMIYVGACEVYLTGTGACVYPLDKASAPADPTKILKFFRAVVLISWPDKTCTVVAGNPPNSCLYVTSTLVSRAPEPNFDLHRPSPTVLTQLLTFYQGLAVTAPGNQLEARGGQLPNTWTVAKLPAGLNMTPTGLINGTPTAAGLTVTTTTVTDKLNRTDTEPITFKVVLQPSVTMPASAANHVQEAVTLQATAANGVGPYVYTATGLAPGLVIDANTGAITGTVTTAGTYSATVTATDQNGVPGSTTYSHVVSPPVTLGLLADQAITLNARLTLQAVGAGGDGNYTYSATGLPTGVTINQKSGAINDKVGISGRFLPTITVTDGLGGTGGTASQRIVVIVNTTNSLIFSAPALAAPDQTTVRGTPASLTLTTTGSVLSPVVTVSGLPPGLTYNVLSGVIAGTPTTAGIYTVTATATTVTATSVLTLLWTVT